MSKHRLDPALFGSTTWLIEPSAGESLLAAVTAGNLEVDVPEVPVIYQYQYAYYPTAEHANTTAIVTFSGVIYADWSVMYAMAQLRSIALDPNISSVVMRGSGPGGSSDAGEKFARFVAEYPLPIVFYVDYGMACSAFYQVACSCDAIVASRPRDKIGSIGTYISWQSYKGMYEKSGIKQVDIYADQSTQKNEEGKAAEKGDFSLLKKWATDAATDFIDYVKEQRGTALTETEGMDPFKGRIFSATDALAIGLIDKIGTLEEAIALVRSLPTESTTSTQNMLGFVKLAALSALAGVAAEDVTEAQVDALSAELAEKGYNVLVVRASDLEAANTLATENAQLKLQLETANTKVTALEGEKSTLTSEVARLGKQPAVPPTTVSAAGDSTPPGEPDDAAAILANLPHNKALEGNIQFN